MKAKWIRAAAAFLLAAVLLAAPCCAVTIGGATVTGSSVRLRTGTDTTSCANVLTEMPKGTFLLVEEKLDGWYKVVCNGTEGYVSADFADFAQLRAGDNDGSFVNNADRSVNGILHLMHNTLK